MQKMVQERKNGKAAGVPSYCTANEIVIEALIRQAKELDVDILIEATANQVNQFGGYTGMKPADFRDFVYGIADRADYPHDRIVLGGDHLGPLTWVNEKEEDAMGKAETLVRLFVEAGYKKIHLDTSMRVADDPADKPLTDETVAKRGARLYQACEDSYQELLKKNPSEKRPVFIIGSEVPIPGGAQEQEDSITVTKPEAVAALLNRGVIDLAQLHGSEDAEYIRRLRDLTDSLLFQAFRIRSKEDLSRAAASAADEILLDAGAGTGTVFDWSLLRNMERRYFLAGGLNPENVREAIRDLHPYGVDVSSGIETDALKDRTKMAAFVAAVREEDRR